MSKTTPTRMALVQMRPADSVPASLDKAASLVAEAAAMGAAVVCLPELFATPYFCQEENPDFFRLAEPLPGPTTVAMGKAAARAGVWLAVPMFERRGAGIYHNTVVLLDPMGWVAGSYRKMHIPDDPRYQEKYYFTPGDTGFVCHDTAAARIGIMICWDQWYPEAARIMALAGAQIIFYPTAIGWLPEEKALSGAEQMQAWRTVQRGHAIANGCYVAAVNRVGLEKPSPDAPGIEFWGSSFIADPMGTVLAQAPADEEAVICADMDPSRQESVRQDWPFLRDRRIDAYAPILERYLDPDRK